MLTKKLFLNCGYKSIKFSKQSVIENPSILQYPLNRLKLSYPLLSKYIQLNNTRTYSIFENHNMLSYNSFYTKAKKPKMTFDKSKNWKQFTDINNQSNSLINSINLKKFQKKSTNKTFAFCSEKI